MTGRVLVTGAAGFIGSHTCRAFLEDGWEVIGVDNFDPFYDRSLKEVGLADLGQYPAFQFVEQDIREQLALTRLLDEASVVIHLAARPGVRPSIEDPELYVSVNVQGTVSVLEACRGAGVHRLVFGSSSSVYGDDTPVPFREDAEAVMPISPGSHRSDSLPSTDRDSDRIWRSIGLPGCSRLASPFGATATGQLNGITPTSTISYRASRERWSGRQTEPRRSRSSISENRGRCDSTGSSS